MNFFSRLKSSIIDFSAYNQFAKESFGRALGYLMIFALIFSLISQAGFIYDYTQVMGELRPHIDQLPEFTISNGILKVDADTPYIVDQDGKNVVAFIDSQDLDTWLAAWENGVFMTQEQMIFLTNGETVETLDFSVYSGITINKGFLNTLVNVGYIILPLIVLGAYIGFVIAKLLSALVVAILGIIIANAVQVKLSFGALYAMSIYALTLPSIIRVGYRYLPLDINWTFHIVYYGIAAVYIWKAAESIKNSQLEVPGELTE